MIRIQVLILLTWPAVALVGCTCSSQQQPEPEAPASLGGSAPAPAVDEGPWLPRCSEVVVQGTLANGQIHEASGMVASARHPGVYYLHNDSGDEPRFFAIDETGADLGSYTVAGARSVDWEDVAVGRCAEGSCLYLGDVGDNRERRDDYVVYQVPEPAAVGPGEHQVSGVALPFRYPDGSHDSETLLVHPATGALFVLTKSWTKPSKLYEFPMPFTPDQPALLSERGSLVPPTGANQVTGGDIHPGGAGVLLRTYSHVFFYALGKADLATALAAEPRVLPAAVEAQGEAVAWTAAGDGYLTVSEGAGSALHRSHCRAE